MHDLIETHGCWGLHLMQHEPWDVFMLHFLSLDVMQHAMWRFMDKTHPRHQPGTFENAIRDGYIRVDTIIGQMLGRLDDNTVVLIMSDHGFGPLHAIVNLNNYLMRRGFLKLKRDPWTQLKAFAFRWGLTPTTVFRWMSRLRLQNLAARVSKGTRNKMMGRFLSYDSVDWSHTLAYSMGHVGQIYLNIAGRESHGIVTEQNYDMILEKVMAALSDMQDESGRPLVTKLIPRAETYHGPYVEHGPDLHIVLDDYKMISFPLFAVDDKIITQQIRGDSGCHRSEGIFIASGPGIQRGETLAEANLIDLSPTILHLVGLPVRRDMDGRVLTEMYTDDYLATLPMQFETAEFAQGNEAHALSEEEAQELEDRLRGLGYLG
jgi:predicted AlkP superfamily phosphohydrolase/phosphomutase